MARDAILDFYRKYRIEVITNTNSEPQKSVWNKMWDSIKGYVWTRIDSLLLLPLRNDMSTMTMEQAYWASNIIHSHFEATFGKKDEFNYIHPNPIGKALVLLPSSDHNGAFSLGHQSPNLHLVSMIYRRFTLINIARSYSVETRRISSPEEMKQVIEQVGKIERIKLLIIKGHGLPNEIQFGEGEAGILRPSFLRAHHFFKYLRRDASVIVRACSTGQIQREGNIAQAIAKAAPGRKVFAPKGISLASDLVISQLNPIKCHFIQVEETKDSKGSTEYRLHPNKESSSHYFLR